MTRPRVFVGVLALSVVHVRLHGLHSERLLILPQVMLCFKQPLSFYPSPSPIRSNFAPW